MKTHTLIANIQAAFKGVELEDGIGLWEAKGLYDYATQEECKKLRAKDEKEDWNKISIADLCICGSSLSYFDTKGLRFHLPKFLLHALDVFEEEENLLDTAGKLDDSCYPEVFFSLTGDLESDYSIQRFSALNNDQIQCVIDFLYYKKQESAAYYKEFGFVRGSDAERDAFFKEIEYSILIWKRKLK